VSSKDSFEKEALIAFCAGLSGVLDADRLTCGTAHRGMSTYQTLAERTRHLGIDPRTARRRLGAPDAQLIAGEKIIGLYIADQKVREINHEPQEIQI
jgi:hypothetical protein